MQDRAAPLASRASEQETPSIIEGFPERANLYRLSIAPAPDELYLLRHQNNGKPREDVFFGPRDGAVAVEPRVGHMRRLLRREIADALRRAGYKIKDSPSSLIIDTRENYAPRDSALRMYTAFEWRIMWFEGRFYLCLDHQLKVQSLLSLAKLLGKQPTFELQPSQQVLFRAGGDWYEGALVHADGEVCNIVTEDDEEIQARASDVVPRLSRRQIGALAPVLNIKPSDLELRVKRLSFLVGSKAALARLDACNEFARSLSKSPFPIVNDGTTVSLDPEAAVLRPPAFQICHDLTEPEAAFDHVDHSKRAGEIREGLLAYGAYDRCPAPLRLVLVGTKSRTALLRGLVQRINDGSSKYRGTLPTFGNKLEIVDVIESRTVEEYQESIREFVRGPARQETELALVYLPRAGNSADLRHPYFRTKGLLLREGLASQMVDEGTIQNPQWKDLSLSLKMYAKAGYAPWVLDEAITGADMFVGLSSSFVKEAGRIQRTVGYVNVFDNYGRWRFYQGDTIAFSFQDRILHYDELVKNSLAAYRAEHGGPIRSLHFHQTKRFSAEERRALAAAVRRVIPDSEVTFVHVNVDHALRLYDLSSPDGRIGRATYLRDDPRSLYLATTGRNIYGQHSMGTPIPVSLSVDRDPEDSIPNLREVAQQILALTRLNWASSHSFCHEPITTKFAGRIAYFMNAFLQDPAFQVSASLRRTPWFL